jgi:hypothetical protein
MGEKTASYAADRALTGRWTLGFGIEAIFTVKYAVFTVREEIPNLQSDSEIDFILVLTLMDSQMTADVQDLLITLVSKLLFSSAFGCTSPDIQDQLGQDYDTRGVVSAQLVMHRNAGGSMFLQRLSMALATGFDWSSLDNVTLKRVECTAMVSRPDNDPKTEWNYQLEIASAFTIKDSDVVARIVFDMGRVYDHHDGIPRHVQDADLRLRHSRRRRPEKQGRGVQGSRELAVIEPDLHLDLGRPAGPVAGGEAVAGKRQRVVDPQLDRLAVRCPGAVWLSPKSILFSQMLLSDLGVDFRAVQMTSAPAKTLLDSTVQHVIHHDDTGLVHVITLV